MEATNTLYDVNDSDSRIREILESSASFDELKEIPTRDQLTYTNGFNVFCSALFIDIRGSSSLPDKHTRPTLGKIYRSYISECVAIMNSSGTCREVFIHGDCVSGVFSTPYKSNVDEVFSTAAKLNSLIKLLNWRLNQHTYTEIQCGIGMAYGKALMMKAGYKGSGLNELIWMGDVLNEASNLCHQGNKGLRLPLQVSNDVYANLNDHNKSLLRPAHIDSIYHHSNYEGDVINIVMNDWLEEKKAVANALALRLFGLS